VFIDSFHTYFLPRDFFTRMADQVSQRKQGFSESFKDYMIGMQMRVRPLNYSAEGTLTKLHPQSKDLPKGVQSVGPGHADDISR